jgi:hypothetical protein
MLKHQAAPAHSTAATVQAAETAEGNNKVILPHVLNASTATWQHVYVHCMVTSDKVLHCHTQSPVSLK